MNPKVLIIPTDFSTHARNAIDFAYQKIKKNRPEVEVRLLHSLPPLHGSFKVSLHLEEMRTKEAKAQMQNEMAYVLQTYRDVPDGKVVEGHPERLVERVNKLENAYIIMSSKGETNVADKLLGSVAEKTIQNAQIPVLVLPNGPFIPIQRICIALDNLNNSLEGTLDHIKQLKVAEEQPEISRVYVQDTLQETTVIEPFEQKGYQVKTHIGINESISQGLIDYIEKQQVDLLCLHHRHRGFFHYLLNLSVSKKMLANIMVPTLVLPQ